MWIGATYEKAATKVDSVETIVSVIMLIAMFAVLGYLYLKFRRPETLGKKLMVKE